MIFKFGAGLQLIALLIATICAIPLISSQQDKAIAHYGSATRCTLVKSCR